MDNVNQIILERLIKQYKGKSCPYIDKKLTRIGVGFSAEVYDLDTDYVVRASYNEVDGWRVLTYLSPEVRERLMLPRIYAHWECPKTGREIAIVEKLVKLPYIPMELNPVNLEEFNGPFKIPDIDTLMSKDNIFYKAVKTGIRTFNFLNRAGFQISGLDLNYANIMLRKDGSLVLNDCLGARDI